MCDWHSTTTWFYPCDQTTAMRIATANQQRAIRRHAPAACVDIAAPAKINLFLEILGKRTDGFHELETVMATVDLADQLRLTPRTDSQIRLTLFNDVSTNQQSQSVTDSIPTDERNLVVRALHCLRQWAIEADGLSEHINAIGDTRNATASFGCNVLLRKRIPSAAGLGGASSDAASALIAGCRLWGLAPSHQQLHRMASELGSDVPFFLSGGVAVCRGRGELIEPLPCPFGIPIVIAKPRAGLSTPLVFQHVHLPTERVESTAIQQSVVTGNPQKTAQGIFNRLQPIAMKLSDSIEPLSRAFAATNACGHQMSGSGTSYFGVYPTARAAQIAAQTLSDRLPEVKIFCCRISVVHH